jgi:hypothetical protein
MQFIIISALNTVIAALVLYFAFAGAGLMP